MPYVKMDLQMKDTFVWVMERILKVSVTIKREKGDPLTPFRVFLLVCWIVYLLESLFVELMKCFFGLSLCLIVSLLDSFCCCCLFCLYCLLVERLVGLFVWWFVCCWTVCCWTVCCLMFFAGLLFVLDYLFVGLFVYCSVLCLFPLFYLFCLII